MSVPDFTGDVARARRLTVRGQLPVTGEWVTLQTDAFEAVAVQHEVDHTLGLLFLDRVAGPHAIHPRRTTSEGPARRIQLAPPRGPTGRGRRLKIASVRVRISSGARTPGGHSRANRGAARAQPEADGPLGVDHRVDDHVADGAIPPEVLVTQDAVLLGTESLDGAAGAAVVPVGPELHRDAVEDLERPVAKRAWPQG